MSFVSDVGGLPEDSRYGTLVANTVASVELDADFPVVVVVNEHPTLWIYVIVDPADGVHPGIRVDGSLPVPPAMLVKFRSPGRGNSTVELKSSGTPNYCVFGER